MNTNTTLPRLNARIKNAEAKIIRLEAIYELNQTESLIRRINKTKRNLKDFKSLRQSIMTKVVGTQPTAISVAVLNIVELDGMRQIAMSYPSDISGSEIKKVKDFLEIVFLHQFSKVHSNVREVALYNYLNDVTYAWNSDLYKIPEFENIEFGVGLARPRQFHITFPHGLFLTEFSNFVRDFVTHIRV